MPVKGKRYPQGVQVTRKTVIGEVIPESTAEKGFMEVALGVIGRDVDSRTPHESVDFYEVEFGDTSVTVYAGLPESAR